MPIDHLQSCFFILSIPDLKEYCQFESFVADCTSSEVVLIQQAQYGRMKKATSCIDGAGYTGCKSDATDYLHKMCSGRRHCEVKVSDLASIFQPCERDFISYLEAAYTCVQGKIGTLRLRLRNA